MQLWLTAKGIIAMGLLLLLKKLLDNLSSSYILLAVTKSYLPPWVGFLILLLLVLAVTKTTAYY